ncbi:MAG: hypothetical protein SGBAC_011291, partial [Bacillariaceae sp.]
MMFLKQSLFFLLTLLPTSVLATPTLGTVTQIQSFSVPRSPSGLFFDEQVSGLLYVLCGTSTNGDHYIYAYTIDGIQQCLITIPQAVAMSRVDGFYIVNNEAYIVDSQGPIYADSGRLGGSVYEVTWNDPCGCASGTCSASSVQWSPTVLRQWSISAADVSAAEGGGMDEYFRNSGIVVVDNTWYGVNGVHPISGSHTVSYTKSIVQVDMSTTDLTVVDSWSFDGSTVGHDVDMEGLTCGPDGCSSTLYVGDEYNYIYALNLETGEVGMEWDLNLLVGNVPVDKGIESLTYASTTGYYYAGIQETAEIHVVSLSTTPDEGGTDVGADDGATGGDNTEEEDSPPTGTTATTLNQCTATDDYPKCAAASRDSSAQRVRREVRSLSTEEWDKVVAAMWIMKTESMATGQAAYGSSFKSYDYFVAKHAVATTDSRGDQAHFGALFITWHTAFVLEFEMSLLAVDPSIEAMPYWDETISEPSVFTEDYFGVDPAADSESKEVTSGRFANWPVSSEFSLDDYAAYIADSSTITFAGSDASPSILRGENMETSAFATRYGSGSGWEVSPPTADTWWGCTTDSILKWNDWYSCIEQGRQSLHSGPHASIGGRGPDGTGTRVTSPNGPIFMFHHANLDRNRMWWMLRHSDEETVCKYYGFPLSDGTFIGPGRDGNENGAFDGAHLNDVVSSSWGFAPEDLGVEAEIDETTSVAQSVTAGTLMTHADMICYLNPDTAAYTYDTNVDCLNDSSTCHAIQGVVESVTVVDDSGDA